MIRQLNKIIEDYINEENTDYAIMINGKWGSGKSYYLYNEGKKNIKNKKYKPVIISLYGLSSIEDFYYRIFWGLCSFANRKVVSFISSAIERVAEHWNVSKLSAKELKKLIKISNSTILIFDDLERVSKNVSVTEILGLINLFSEIEHKKVIVVCNEEEIDEHFKDEYKKFKEKTFRYSYWYEKNIEDIFDELIKDNSSYNTFLRNERKTILDIFGCGGNNNLRTFHFIIETFEKIYNKEEQHKYKHKTEILQILLVSYVIYVCEYKGGASKEQLNRLGETSIINFFFRKT